MKLSWVTKKWKGQREREIDRLAVERKPSQEEEGISGNGKEVGDGAGAGVGETKILLVHV